MPLPIDVNQAQRNFAAAAGGGMQGGPAGPSFQWTPQDYQQMALQMENANDPATIAKLMFKASAMTGNPDYARNAASMFNTQGTNSTNMQLGQMQSADNRYGVDVRARTAMQQLQAQRQENMLDRRHRSSESALGRQHQSQESELERRARARSERQARRLERDRMGQQQDQWQQGFDRAGQWRTEDNAYRDDRDAVADERYDQGWQRQQERDQADDDFRDRTATEQERANQERERQSGLMTDHQVEMGRAENERAQAQADADIPQPVPFEDGSAAAIENRALSRSQETGIPASVYVASDIQSHESYPDMRELVNYGDEGIAALPQGWLGSLVRAEEQNAAMVRPGNGLAAQRDRYRMFLNKHGFKHSPMLANEYGRALGNEDFWEGFIYNPSY